MSKILENYKYLNKFFPADFIDSLTKDNFLYRLLVDEDRRADVLRQEIDDCLELVFRYDLVDADLEARLRKGDWGTWEAAISELKIAKFLEKIFGRGCLRWRPQGKDKKVGEFELVINKTDKLIFIEVKTIFPRELEQLEDNIRQKLFRYAEQVPIPSFLSVHITSPGTSESFSGRKFKDFLARELPAINPDDLKRKSIKLPDYKDDNTGLQLEIETLQIIPKEEEKACHIGVIGGEARAVRNEVYIRHSLNKAYAQLPARKNKPCLVILCSSTEFPINEKNMLNVWMGTLEHHMYWHKNGTFSKPVPLRKRDSYIKPQYNRKLSAAGLYSEKFNEKGIEGNLEIYHNPWAGNPLDRLTFKGVRQLVNKNNKEMEWIE